MNKNALIALIAIIVITGALFLFSNKEDSDYITISPNSIEESISYDMVEDKTKEEVVEDKFTKTEADTIYTLVSSESSMGWQASKIVGTTHTGLVELSSGTLYEDGGVFTAGEFTIDMTKISESNNTEKFLAHIISADFFDVENNPTSKLSVTKIENTNGDEFNLTANLTIMGKTNEITFPATITKDTDNVHALAKFSIDRTDWEIKYGSGQFFKELGDKAIKDEINFNLDLNFSVEK